MQNFAFAVALHSWMPENNMLAGVVFFSEKSQTTVYTQITILDINAMLQNYFKNLLYPKLPAS